MYDRLMVDYFNDELPPSIKKLERRQSIVITTLIVGFMVGGATILFI